MQAHPSRVDLRPALLEALKPLYVEFSEHSSIPPDPWAGYQQCLKNLPDCTHVLVIQDDALPVPNFSQVLPRIARDVPVCLFLGAVPASTAALARRAMIRGTRYIPLQAATFVPLVACLWPRAKAQEFLRWGRSVKTTRADDGNAAKWVRRTKQQILVTVPSLVEHNDYVPSVKGGREHKPGAESWRRALILAEDALSFEW